VRPGPQRKAEIAPSKGERRPGHRGHKPVNVLAGYRQRSVKVVRMYEALCESGWKFRFKAEAVSPRGFKYEAEGDTAEEAFLKAFGTWRDELYAAPPKVPAAAPAPVAKPKRQYRPRNLPLVDAWVKPVRQPHTLRPLPIDPKAKRVRVYRRIYMRAYRDQKRTKNDRALVMAA
jgi:hypothetical protein